MGFDGSWAGGWGRFPGRWADLGSFRRCLAVSWLILALVTGGLDAAEPPQPADELLRLVPPEATAVLTVEGLRDQARAWADSRLASDLRRLPVVRAWLESDQYRRLERSCREIESFLDVRLAELRDEVLGDAVVLVLQLACQAPSDPSQARGLLLLRARDPALLERLIRAINAAQRNHGELAGVGERRRAGMPYHHREFPAGERRLPEWYVTFPDGTFAFSNSEALIQAVIDRKGRGSDGQADAGSGGGAKAGVGAGAPITPGLGDLPTFRALRRRQPARALARLFVDPRAIERSLRTAARPRQPGEPRILDMTERYLAAVDYAGAALVWGADAIVLHWVETLRPSRLDPWLRRWAGDRRSASPALGRVPATALALASAHLDHSAMWDAVFRLVPEADHARLHNLEAVLSGLLLGQDLRTRILPVLGPGAIAYLDAPAEPAEAPAGPGSAAGRAGWFPLVLVLGFSEESGMSRPVGASPERPPGPRSPTVSVAAALETGLHTVLALTALDPNRGQGRARIATRDVAGATVMTLDVPLAFAFAVDRVNCRLVLGTSAAAVVRYLESSSDPEAGRRFRDLQAAAFPDAETFVCVDLDALTRFAGRDRGRLARILAARQTRPAAEVERDLDHVLALARLFRAAFLTSRMEPDADAVHRSLGVLLQAPGTPSSRQP
jgi:hypothetical protein